MIERRRWPHRFRGEPLRFRRRIGIKGGAIHGPTLCLRKELETSAVKLLDFEPSSSNQVIVQKTFYEILYSDKRLAIGYADGKRWRNVANKVEIFPAGLRSEKGDGFLDGVAQIAVEQNGPLF